jgi:hypothetical protein
MNVVLIPLDWSDEARTGRRIRPDRDAAGDRRGPTRLLQTLSGLIRSWFERDRLVAVLREHAETWRTG